MRFITRTATAVIFLGGRLVATQQSGAFTVLTYNVAGLPEPLSGSDPVNNTPKISSLINPYDIVNVQEDFNYHHLLVASDKHPHKTATTGGVPFGSGLNTFSNFPISDLQRITWSACWFNSGDCLTPKGFTAKRVTIAPGVAIDIYNLHAEAGDSDLDFSARKVGLAQLRDFIKNYSVGAAVILFGDTNTRFYQAKDNIRYLTDGAGLTDVWTQLLRGGTPPALGSPNIECPFPGPNNSPPPLDCEIIDKIMYRSSPLIKLTPKSFINEHLKFLTGPGGAQLSDHFPLAVPFDWQLSPSLRESESELGPTNGNSAKGSTRFNDLSILAAANTPFMTNTQAYVTSLTLRTGTRVDGISYSLSSAPTASIKHGGTGGSPSPVLVFNQASKEVINSVEACVGSHDGNESVHYMRVDSSAGRSLEGGKRTGNCKIWKAPSEGWGLVGFKGRKGTEISRLGVVWGKI